MLAGDVLVVADRAQHPAKRRTRRALQQDECHCEHRQDDALEALLEHLWRDDAAPGPGMPSEPLVSQISLVAAMRTDSEKPSVTIVR